VRHVHRWQSEENEGKAQGGHSPVLVHTRLRGRSKGWGRNKLQEIVGGSWERDKNKEGDRRESTLREEGDKVGEREPVVEGRNNAVSRGFVEHGEETAKFEGGD